MNSYVEALWKYGYLHNKVEQADISMLALNDQVVRDAMARYQDFCYYPLNGLVRAAHNRDLIPDGDVGPATSILFSMPRCEVPDEGPSSRPLRAGSGSWPSSCQKDGIKMFVDLTNCPVRDQWPAIQTDIIEAYRLIGRATRVVTSIGEANVHVYWRSFFGSTIGLAEFNSRSCSDKVFLSMSMRYVGENRGLFKHEWGHNDNLSHTRGGTMNSYIIKEPHPRGFWQESDPSYSTLVRYFDGVPVGEPGPVDPPPPPIDPPPIPESPRRPILEWFRRWFNF